MYKEELAHAVCVERFPSQLQLLNRRYNGVTAVSQSFQSGGTVICKIHPSMDTRENPRAVLRYKRKHMHMHEHRHKIRARPQTSSALLLSGLLAHAQARAQTQAHAQTQARTNTNTNVGINTDLLHVATVWTTASQEAMDTTTAAGEEPRRDG
jgi:hypothetical protein